MKSSLSLEDFCPAWLRDTSVSHLHHGDNRKPLLQTGGAEFDRCGCLLDMDGRMKDTTEMHFVKYRLLSLDRYKIFGADVDADANNSADHSYFNLNRTDYMTNRSLSHISHTTLFSVLCVFSLYLWVLEKTKHLKMWLGFRRNFLKKPFFFIK